jgi:hypothetical protein
MRRANDNAVVIIIRGKAEMITPTPTVSSIFRSGKPTSDFPKAVVHLGKAKDRPQGFPGSMETNNNHAAWDAMDAIADKIALILVGNEPFEILPNTASAVPVPVGSRAQRHAIFRDFRNRRDDLGTTHHDAGTMRMGNNIAGAIINDFSRIHDGVNSSIVNPALSPPWDRQVRCLRVSHWVAIRKTLSVAAFSAVPTRS